MRLGNLLKLVLRLEVCLLQAKGLCSGSDIMFPSPLIRLGLQNKSEARLSVTYSCTRDCLRVPDYRKDYVFNMSLGIMWNV